MTDPSDPPTRSATELAQALAQSEARYAWLIERGRYGAYKSTPDGRFLDANSALGAMLGYASVQELLSLDIARDVYLDPADRVDLLGRDDAALRDWVTARWKRRDGTAITVRLTINRIVNAHGDVEAYEGLVDDITERDRRDELLRRSERMASLGTTLSGIAHELNNPLAAIMGFTQLLMRKPWSSEDRTALETINHEAIRSATIVKDLLTLTRTRDVDGRIPTDINDIVGYIARTRRYGLETSGVTCTIELDPTLPPVDGDRAQLEQVLVKLLANAEHALTQEPRSHGRDANVTIRTRRDDHDAVIEIEDNGPGVPEDARSRIWDPFWTTKPEGEGIGLGLAVVHGIIVDHGGSITVETGSSGTGARFIIRIPIADETLARVPKGQAQRPLDILVVDPGASDLVLIERAFTARGHAVVNSGSADLALRLANQMSFDAVVCDARLLCRDGSPVAAALRGTTGCANARFILSVPAGMEAQVPQGTIDGGTVVTRPYDVHVLRRLIEGD